MRTKFKIYLFSKRMKQCTHFCQSPRTNLLRNTFRNQFVFFFASSLPGFSLLVFATPHWFYQRSLSVLPCTACTSTTALSQIDQGGEVSIQLVPYAQRQKTYSGSWCTKDFQKEQTRRFLSYTV